MSNRPASTFLMRRFTSLFLGFCALVSLVSGFVLYVVPAGRLADWNGWSLFGLSKSEWGSLHTIPSFFFFVLLLFHLFYNWNVLMAYLKDRISRSFTLTKELVIAVVLTLIVIHGSIVQYQPFGAIMHFGEYTKGLWYQGEKQNPPFGHAELASMKSLSQKMGFKTKSVLLLLQESGFPEVTPDTTLADLAQQSGKTPAHIFDQIANDDRAYE
ncbi:DUF4405 domain-containing protein [Chrysiogenes arsenatis]|uniref:DUF4405 domain-containing protein n=1 Tax=Chrysiogenes arsenatis TaxID=309797 RepID=UPI000487A2CA|nr:DUF4405 domain-containing protein [Chrysiogenes arsenatis]